MSDTKLHDLEAPPQPPAWIVALLAPLDGLPGPARQRRETLAAVAASRCALPAWEAVRPADRRPRQLLDAVEARVQEPQGTPVSDDLVELFAEVGDALDGVALTLGAVVMSRWRRARYALNAAALACSAALAEGQVSQGQARGALTAASLVVGKEAVCAAVRPAVALGAST